MLRLRRIHTFQQQYRQLFSKKAHRMLSSSLSESEAESSISSDSRVGLLMDMDNLLIPDNEGQFEDTDVLKAVLKESEKYGRVVVRKAYMDSKQWSSIREELAARAIEILDMPILNHHSQKNSADIKLSLDALCLSMEDVCDTFVIASGDSDFTPLCQKLREQNKTTVVVSRFGTTSKVLANFADHAATVDDLILCRPLDWHDCEPAWKAAMILSCGLQNDEAWISTSRVSSLMKQLPQNHPKQQTLKLKTLLRRSDVDKYFRIKKEDDGNQMIRMRSLSESELTHDRKIEFTDYENSLLLQEVLYNRLDIKVWRDPVVLGHALRLIYDELSSSEETSLEINEVANEVREKLHVKSMSIARARSRRLVQLLVSIGILETVSSDDGSTNSIREMIGEDNQTEDADEDGEYEVKQSPSNETDGVVRISKDVDSSSFSSFRTAIDCVIVQNIRNIVEGDGYSVNAQDFHTLLYGPGLNVNGKEIPMPKTRQGEFVEMLESKNLTMYRIERILEGENPTELPAVSDDVDVDEEETKISFLSRLRRRWSGR